ncbi:hypothetical protein BTI90_08155, partial [Lactobacillus delbrueckii subsp. bulgaricus]|nr:hypothetical protein [Lactobacillus delbrueckii subsp. bulgaricus]MBT9047885.1 hypothetical protein [Lactobacillus delbrueckii subsp. bulgaricus]
MLLLVYNRDQSNRLQFARKELVCLENEALFDEVEAELKKHASIQDFEEKYGKITGRMMITETEIP